MKINDTVVHKINKDIYTIKEVREIKLTTFESVEQFSEYTCERLDKKQIIGGLMDSDIVKLAKDKIEKEKEKLKDQLSKLDR